ncbi:MAG TPA: PEP-utilizing enzyme, partial [Acidimicrobiales bacterium]|nr:PEP-utilizing enzyme [Acidimicrobiales bacterium]
GRPVSLPAPIAPAAPDGAAAGPLATGPEPTAERRPAGSRRDGDRLADQREQLRLRVRWLHQLTAVVAEELGRRLAGRGLLAEAAAVRWLRLGELEAAVLDGAVPPGLEARRLAPVQAPLPAAFRVAPSGDVVPVAPGGRRGAGTGHGAGGGRAEGRVVQDAGQARPGDVLVVRTLDPGLAAVLPRVAGLVAETGSVLSHLAILAREFGVATVVAVPDALHRFPPGALVLVDGLAGSVEVVTRGEAA